MKQLNYERQPKNYKELFDNNRDLYVSIEHEGVDILNERMPFGKYSGMRFIDLIQYDRNYFSYIKNVVFNNPVSNNLNTYSQRVKMLRVMISVERYYSIERWSESYEQGRNRPAINFGHSATTN